jgi:hypothetical protein
MFREHAVTYGVGSMSLTSASDSWEKHSFLHPAILDGSYQVLYTTEEM